MIRITGTMNSEKKSSVEKPKGQKNNKNVKVTKIDQDVTPAKKTVASKKTGKVGTSDKTSKSSTLEKPKAGTSDKPKSVKVAKSGTSEKAEKVTKKKTSVQDEDEPIEIDPVDDAISDVVPVKNTKQTKKNTKSKETSSITSKDRSTDGDSQSLDEDEGHSGNEASVPELSSKPKPKGGKKAKKTKEYTMADLLLNFDPAEEIRKDAEEDILKEANFRLAVKPIDPKYQVIWNLYKKQHEAHWTAEEIDFSNDRHDFMKLDKNIQHFIKMIFAFFAGADSIVNINIKKKFSRITVKEAEIAYGFQQMMENIHGEVYADMLINVIEDATERDELINAFKKVKSIKLMIEWAQKWIDVDRRIGFSIVAFTIFEGIMFSGAFAAIYWLKKSLGEDKMKGLTQSNNLIAKDEGMHTNFGCVMYDYVKHRLSQEEITVMMVDAVDIAKSFTQDAIRVDLIGMNVNLMSAYLEYVADRLLVYLGHEKIYNTPIPDQFQFMDTIGFLNKDNFFERRSTEYQKAYNNNNRADWKFKINHVY